MYIIFDKMTATLVGTIVLVMLIGLQSRIQSNTVESTIMYAAKKQTLAFAEILERDLSNAGYLTTPGETAVLAYSNRFEAGRSLTDTLEFWGSDAIGDRVRIRYALEPAGYTVSDGVAVPLYSVARYENNLGIWKLSGASMPTLTAFRVDLLDSGSNGVVDVADARKMRVRFENAIVGHQTKDSDGRSGNVFLRRLRWGVTLSPRGLAQQAFQG